MKKFNLASIFVLCIVLIACNGKQNNAAAEKEDTRAVYESRLIGEFNADSAFQYIKNQVEFGPRVPGLKSHDSCASYIIEELERFAADSLIVQKAEVTAFDGAKLPITNIMARYNPEKSRRVLLAAHWDTRPWADKEPDAERRLEPIPGANDGASGVGVLLEIARNFSLRDPEVGVDLLFVDAEDYGNSTGFGNNDETWCLGTQHWVENMPYKKASEMPVYGILLDMVGGRDAHFHQEAFSMQHAPAITNKVWAEAANLGYDDVFVNSPGGAVIDDHVFLSDAGIPTTDIIETLNDRTASFPPTWHTHDDNLDNIDIESLEAVGRTVLNVVYKEKNI